MTVCSVEQTVIFYFVWRGDGGGRIVTRHYVPAGLVRSLTHLPERRRQTPMKHLTTCSRGKAI